MEHTVLQALELMLYGLGGVFASLAILWGAIKIIGRIFPYKPDVSDTGNGK